MTFISVIAALLALVVSSGHAADGPARFDDLAPAALAPDNPGVLIPRAAVQLERTRGMPPGRARRYFERWLKDAPTSGEAPSAPQWPDPGTVPHSGASCVGCRT